MPSSESRFVPPFSRGKNRDSDDGIPDGIRRRTDKGYATCYGSGREKYDSSAQMCIRDRTYSRTIEAFHYLRPIPQGQLDGMEMTEEEKDAYQNPGYRD